MNAVAWNDGSICIGSAGVRPIYAADCACSMAGAMPGMRRYVARTDIEATQTFLAWKRKAEIESATLDPPPARYFVVHGPGGHVIGVR